MGSRRVVVLCLVAAAIGASACSSDDPQPDPLPTTTSVPTTTLGAPPPVADPRDVRPFADRPCELLTVEQRVELGVTEIGFDGFPNLVENRCTWELNEVREQAVVRVYPDIDALATAYVETRGYGVIRPTEVDGLPGLLQQQSPQSRVCLVTVGIESTQGLSVQFSDRTGDVVGDAICRRARAVAQEAVRNLPPFVG